MNELTQFLTVKNISLELELSERTVRELLKTGKLPGRKIAGKYICTREQLKNFIESKN